MLFENKYINLDGISLHYRVSGPEKGTPVILMHGWGCKAETLASIEKVAAETHRVYNIDFPGFGESSEPREVWGVERYTQILEQFINKLDISVPVLLGHSFGGRVGLLYSSRNLVSKLILVDAAGVKPKRKLKYYFKVYSFKFLKVLSKICMGGEGSREYIERQCRKRGSQDYQNSTPMMRAILSRVVNEDLKSIMPKIKAPTLLIWGENDTATPMDDAHTMEKLIPGAALVSFPGCGHYSFLDNPIQFQAVLRSFLKS